MRSCGAYVWVFPPAPMVDNPTNQGTPLSTVNKVATGIDTAIADGTTLAETAVEAAAESSQPWLLTFGIKQIFESIVKYVLGIAGKTGQLAITFQVTKAQGALENSALKKAEQEVQTALASGDPNAIAQAEQNFQKSQSTAVNTDGSATPQ